MHTLHGSGADKHRRCTTTTTLPLRTARRSWELHPGMPPPHNAFCRTRMVAASQSRNTRVRSQRPPWAGRTETHLHPCPAAKGGRAAARILSCTHAADPRRPAAKGTRAGTRRPSCTHTAGHWRPRITGNPPEGHCRRRRPPHRRRQAKPANPPTARDTHGRGRSSHPEVPQPPTAHPQARGKSRRARRAPYHAPPTARRPQTHGSEAKVPPWAGRTRDAFTPMSRSERWQGSRACPELHPRRRPSRVRSERHEGRDAQTELHPHRRQLATMHDRQPARRALPATAAPAPQTSD